MEVEVASPHHCVLHQALSNLMHWGAQLQCLHLQDKDPQQGYEFGQACCARCTICDPKYQGMRMHNTWCGICSLTDLQVCQHSGPCCSPISHSSPVTLAILCMACTTCNIQCCCLHTWSILPCTSCHHCHCLSLGRVCYTLALWPILSPPSLLITLDR